MDNSGSHSGGHNRYTLVINDSPLAPDVLRFRGREALSEPFTWEIEFTEARADILPQQALLKFASLHMRDGRSVHGVITRLRRLAVSADQSRYLVELRPRLALLAHTRRCRIYQQRSVPEVVEAVLREHGLEGADFDFRLARRYPERELITQWRESDLQFIQRILAEVGIWWRTEMDDARGLEVVIFADSQQAYRFGVRLPYCEPSGLFDGGEASVWGVRSWHSVATGRVSTRDYNYRDAAAPLDAAVSVRGGAATVGEHYRYAGPYREAGDDGDPEPATETGAFYARLHHERELNRSVRLHLFSNAGHLVPGQVLEPQGTALEALREGMLIALATYRGARDARLHVSLWGMPYTERYGFRPAEASRPAISGTLPARVESREAGDIYAHLDEHGRYRVRLDFDRDDPEQGFAYLWLRLAKPYAGDRYGWHTPLIDGTEVAVAYSGGDIDLPYIAHALHDSAHPDLVTRDNHTRNVLRTPANNKLRMEDRRGEEHIKLATEYGKSQLNLGHLVDNRQQRRGAGVELRTDEWGVVRAGKGLFVSADAQAKGQGDALDMTAALREIEQLQQQLRQLEMAAEQAQALKADIDSQVAMAERRLKPLDETLLFSTPQGMALSSGEHVQLAATENVALNAGGDISIGVMGNMTGLVGDRLGLFARTGALSLKASEGAVTIQAQNDAMRLFGQKKVTILSAEDIQFAGKKRITLIGGGSYLTLEAGRIEYGTTGTWLRRAPKMMVVGAASMALNLPTLPLADLFVSQRVTRFKPVLRISEAPGINGVAQPDRKWQIVSADSYMQAVTTDEVLMSGQTDANGKVLSSEAQQYQLAELATL
jgi:type VI secretion system secreted protein VgrG